jgi:hypothetical protein
MRLGLLAFALIVIGFVLFPVADAAGAASVIVAVGALPLLGYRDGTLRGLRWSGLVPAAALTADVVSFTPWSLQPDTDVVLYTPIALYFLPAWAVLAGSGVVANRAREAASSERARRAWPARARW